MRDSCHWHVAISVQFSDSCANSSGSAQLMRPMHIDHGGSIASGGKVMKIWNAFAEILDESEDFILSSIGGLIMQQEAWIRRTRPDTAESRKKKKENTSVQTEIIHRTAEVTRNVIIIVIDLAPPWNCLWPVRHSVSPATSQTKGPFFFYCYFLFIYFSWAAWRVEAQAHRVTLLSGVIVRLRWAATFWLCAKKSNKLCPRLFH